MLTAKDSKILKASLGPSSAPSLMRCVTVRHRQGKSLLSAGLTDFSAAFGWIGVRQRSFHSAQVSRC